MIKSRQKFSDCQSESRAASTGGRGLLTKAGKYCATKFAAGALQKKIKKRASLAI
jgi:hypothetical protein